MTETYVKLILSIIIYAILIISSILSIIATIIISKKRGRITLFWGILALFIGWIATIIVYFLPDISTEDTTPIKNTPVDIENAFIDYDPKSLGGYSLNKHINKAINTPKPTAKDFLPWNCPVCGKENLGKASHCIDCGYGKDGSWLCQNCGNKNTKDCNFCSNCGNKKPE